ncbi:MAG: methyltransferase domain-containing protein [Myxococcales bacterium]
MNQPAAPAQPAPSPLAVPAPWDLVAEGYSAEVDLIMRPVSLEALRRAQSKAPHAIGPDTSVVDVAAGPGTLTFELASRTKQVDALDFSENMLAELTQGLARRAIQNVRAVQGDGMALPYADASFEAGFSMFGLMFFPDRGRGFRELLRVLKPGGIAVVSSWGPLDISPAMDLMFGALRAADPSMPPPQRNLLSLENAELFEREFKQAGFLDVSVEPYEYFVKLDSAEDYWYLMTRSAAPCMLMRKRLGEEEWARRSEVAQAYLRDAFPKARERLSTTAYLGFGRKV